MIETCIQNKIVIEAITIAIVSYITVVIVLAIYVIVKRLKCKDWKI